MFCLCQRRLGLFQVGDEYATAVKQTNDAARSFQEDTARFFGVDLKRDYRGEEEARQQCGPL